MKRRLLLFLSAEHLQAQLVSGGEIGAQHEFSNSPEGHQAFMALLQTGHCPAYLLVDLVEEDFRQERIPHLRGGTRRALLQRKLEQYYRGSAFRLATRLQRHKTGRRDDDMLLSALTNPAPLSPWLDIMQAQQTPLAGIYSVAQISNRLVEDHPSSHLLLITWERLAGLRQSYFSAHHLQISRLTPAHAGLSYQAAMASELIRMHQYLKSLSLLPTGQTLDVRIVCHADDRDLLQAALPEHAEIRYDFADISRLAGRLRIPCCSVDSDACQIFLHELAAHPPRASYASDAHLHYFSLWRLRCALNWFSATLLLSSLLWSTASAVHHAAQASTTAAINLQAQRLQDEAQRITRSFPNTHAPAADMKAGVTIIRRLAQQAIAPQEILQPISVMLDRFPQIKLEHLGWRITEMLSELPVDSDQVQPATIVLNGSLQDFGNDYRAALTYLDRFQRELIAIGYQVTVIARPLDVSPGAAISDQRGTDENALAFQLQLAWNRQKSSDGSQHETR